MSLVQEVAPQSKRSEEYLALETVEFSRLMRERKHKAYKSPGTVKRISLQQSDSEATRARIIAQRLIEMGDELEKKFGAQLKEDFEKEFKAQSAFKMAYDGFKRVSLGFLGRARGHISTGWEQLYFLNYGHYIVSEELASQAGQEESREHITQMATFVSDVAHEIRLDEWVAAQNLDKMSADEIQGDKLVEIPHESSVDSNNSTGLHDPLATTT